MSDLSSHQDSFVTPTGARCLPVLATTLGSVCPPTTVSASGASAPSSSWERGVKYRRWTAGLEGRDLVHSMESVGEMRMEDSSVHVISGGKVKDVTW